MAQGIGEAPAMTEAYDWRGRKAVDSEGDKVGKIDEIYQDTASGQPEWALVNTGLFGSKSTFVPLSGAKPSGEDVQLSYTNEQIKNAPSIEADGELSHEEEHDLYEHYGLDYGESARGGSGGTTGRDASGPTTDDAMTRSEEELRVGTTSRESGRARLRKYVVTEEVTKTVPVRKEKVTLEREPITDANVGDARSGPEISEEEHEVVLHEEEVVTEKRAVPKERVRMGKETVTEDQTVSEEIRKEQIEAEGAGQESSR